VRHGFGEGVLLLVADQADAGIVVEVAVVEDQADAAQRAVVDELRRAGRQRFVDRFWGRGRLLTVRARSSVGLRRWWFVVRHASPSLLGPSKSNQPDRPSARAS
jgi:hypothetical protein